MSVSNINENSWISINPDDREDPINLNPTDLKAAISNAEQAAIAGANSFENLPVDSKPSEEEDTQALVLEEGVKKEIIDEQKKKLRRVRRQSKNIVNPQLDLGSSDDIQKNLFD